MAKTCPSPHGLGLIWLVGCGMVGITVQTAIPIWPGKRLSCVRRFAIRRDGCTCHSTPPIRFADDDQMSGLHDTELLNCRIPKRKIVPFRNVKVELILQDSQGGVQNKTVLYQVGVTPHLSVFAAITRALSGRVSCPARLDLCAKPLFSMRYGSATRTESRVPDSPK